MLFTGENMLVYVPIYELSSNSIVFISAHVD